jgi:hypothetical protein
MRITRIELFSFLFMGPSPGISRLTLLLIHPSAGPYSERLIALRPLLMRDQLFGGTTRYITYVKRFFKQIRRLNYDTGSHARRQTLKCESEHGNLRSGNGYNIYFG